MEIKIDTEFKSLLRPLSDEEMLHLECSIINDGCRDPLVVWAGILLDGHNRHAICTKNDKKYEVVQAPDWILTRSDCIKWIIDNQRGKRNLTKDEMRYLIGKHYNAAKKERGGDGSNQHTKELIAQSEQIAKTDTAEQIAGDHAVSRATVVRAGEFADKVDALPAEEKQAVLKGEKKLPASKPKPQRDTLAADVIIEGLRGLVSEISDNWPDLDSNARGKIRALASKIMGME